MASVAQQHYTLSHAAVAVGLAPDLCCTNINPPPTRAGRVTCASSKKRDSDTGGEPSEDRACCDPVRPQTASSGSSGPESERIDPVGLLSRPVEGFHHPRQHIFTDRLIGRFFEDTSLDAETRKLNKGLAGCLGNTGGGGGGSTRPGLTATSGAVTPLFRLHAAVVHSSSDDRGRRMQGSASTSSLRTSGGGSTKVLSTARSQRGGGTGLSARKEHIEKEIVEQKALIEELEGRMASLSRGKATDRSNTRKKGTNGEGPRGTKENVSLREDEGMGKNFRDGHAPVSTSARLRHSRDDKYDVDAEPESLVEVRHNTSLVEAPARGKQGIKCADTVRKEDQEPGEDLGVEQPLDVEHVPSQTQPKCVQQRHDSALTIQRNVRGVKPRRKYLSLQSARAEFECHVCSISSLVESLATGTVRKNSTPTATMNLDGGGDVSGVLRVQLQAAVIVVAKILSASREDGLANPPFETLRLMYQMFGELKHSLSSLEASGDTGKTYPIAHRIPTAYQSFKESYKAAEAALDRIRDAVGAAAPDFCKVVGCSSSVSCSTPTKSAYQWPAGSGRAAAVAAASGKGGILMSPEPPESNPPRASTTLPFGNEVLVDRPEGMRRVPLRTLGVEEIGLLLRHAGFAVHASGFVSQAVDGEMLSDPNLCEEDFRELGLGGSSASGLVPSSDKSTANLVNFFTACQRDGAVLPSSAALNLLETVRRGEGGDLSIRTRERATSVQAGATAILMAEGGKGEEAREAGGIGVDFSCENVAFGEVFWRLSSKNSDSKKQSVLASMSLDEVGAESRTTEAVTGVASGETDRVLRMLVSKCDRPVVTTVGGLVPALVGDVDGFGSVDVDTERDEGERSESSSSSPSSAVPPASSANRSRRRSSMGYPTVLLDSDADESTADQQGLSGLSRKGLPPEVVVKWGSVTLDIFQ